PYPILRPSPLLLRSRRPPCSPLFPYTTLFRSVVDQVGPTPPHVVDQHQRQQDAEYRKRTRISAGVGPHPPGPQASRRRTATPALDRKSTRLNSSHVKISYAVFCLKKKKK